ncbi:MAG: chlororespiratory reduction 6 domain-containing protein, partial [Dolichospermum sp.]
HKQDIFSPSRLKSLAQILGYELDDAFFEMIEKGNS